LHQVGDLFELNVKLRCQKVKYNTDSLQYNSCRQNLLDNHESMSKLPVFWDVQLFTLVDVKGCFAEIAASVIKVHE